MRTDSLGTHAPLLLRRFRRTANDKTGDFTQEILFIYLSLYRTDFGVRPGVRRMMDLLL